MFRERNDQRILGESVTRFHRACRGGRYRFGYRLCLLLFRYPEFELIIHGDRKVSLQERTHALPCVETVCRQYLRNVFAAQKYDWMPVFPYFFVCLPAHDGGGD